MPSKNWSTDILLGRFVRACRRLELLTQIEPYDP